MPHSLDVVSHALAFGAWAEMGVLPGPPPVSAVARAGLADKMVDHPVLLPGLSNQVDPVGLFRSRATASSAHGRSMNADRQVHGRTTWRITPLWWTGPRFRGLTFHERAIYHIDAVDALAHRQAATPLQPQPSPGTKAAASASRHSQARQISQWGPKVDGKDTLCLVTLGV